MNNFKEFAKKISYEHLRKINQDQEIYLFGAGGYAKDVAKILLDEGYNLKGFIQSSSSNKVIHNKSVITWDQVPKSATILMGIFNQNYSYTELLAEASSNGFNNVFMPWDTYAQFSQQLGSRYWLTSENFILDNLFNIETVYDFLEDEISKECLLNTCLFRIGLNTEYAKFLNSERHYFNELSLSTIKDKPISFVDGGAYNGDSYADLLTFSQVSKAYLFEPDADNFKKLVENTKGNVIRVPMAISDSYRILSFSGDRGPSSSVVENGGITIAAVSLDEFLADENIDFVKFDIEGSEAAAINGSRKLFNRCRPIVTIALYHKPSDLWELPLLMSSVVKDYKFYIRQHEYNSFESVLYAIPV